ncbi:hypothetical protein [Undibacterium sp. SXout20W]|uniref:hypothetical protein n=1 Tax=Undibacterium sp. SXout20W TaxID=3413051 RepID=UPI003BF33911
MMLFDLVSFVFHQISIPTNSPRERLDVKNSMQRYQIRAACRYDDMLYVESLIRQSLSSICCTIEKLDIPTLKVQEMGIFHIEVRCSENARQHLVQMVGRLGLEGGVRSIRWNAVVEPTI